MIHKFNWLNGKGVPCRSLHSLLLVASTSAKLEELSWPVQVGLQIKLKRSVEADVYSSLKLHKV